MNKYLLAILLSLPLLSRGQVNDLPQDSVKFLILPLIRFEAPVYMDQENRASSYSEYNSRELKRKNFGQDPAFLLSETPGMTFVSDAGSFSGYSYFRLRGIDQTRINVSLNGVPLNEPEDLGIYFSNFPDLLNSVKKLQVHRGVGIYGQGAPSYAGSIQMQTSPFMESNDFIRIGGNYGSFNSFRGFIEGEKQFKNDKGAIYGRSSWLQSDGYKDRSGNTSQSAIFIGQYSNYEHKLSWTAFAGNQVNEMAWLGVPLDSIEKDPKFNANTTEDDQFLQAHAQVTHDWLINNSFQLSTTAFYTFLDGNYDFDLNNFIGFPSTNEMYNYAFRSHWVGGNSYLSWFTSRFHFRGGISANTYQRRHLGTLNTFGELYTNTGFKDELSAFAKGSFDITSRLVLRGEVQARTASFRYQGAVPLDDIRWNFLNFKGGTSYQLGNDFYAYYSFGRTGREPARLDMFQGWDDLITDSLGNPVFSNITPETVLDHEMGIRLRTQKGEKLYISANVNGYAMQFRNEIALNGAFGPSGLPLRSNVAKTLRSGIEVEGSLGFLKPGIWLTHASAFSRNRTTDSSQVFEPILTPSVILNQGVEFRREKFRVGIDLRYQSRAWLDWANSAELPAYTTINLTGAYQLKNWEFNLRLQNITNTQYFGGGYMGFDGTPLYFIQAPFNFMTGFTYTRKSNKSLKRKSQSSSPKIRE